MCEEQVDLKNTPHSLDDCPVVLFAHGKESGPWGEKIVALAEIAQSCGYRAISPDFRGMDDPEERVAYLLEIANGLQGPFVLVGSSMGGYVALRASQQLLIRGLFLMAPAINIPGYQSASPPPTRLPVVIVHAWQDEVIPVQNLIDYAQQHQPELHLVNSDHRLSGQQRFLKKMFSNFLLQVAENNS